MGLNTYFILAIIVLSGWLLIGLVWIYWTKTSYILRIRDRKRYNTSEYPLVSVIIPACNEEKGIEKCIESIVNQEYSNFEVIAINDRSTDSTGSIMERLKHKYPQIKTIHIKELPEEWLGKNHALYTGALEAKGEWFLFTDADVIFSQGSLKLAIGYAEHKKLDHLTAGVDLVCNGLFQKIFTAYFTILATIIFTLQKYGGLGAFNLIKKSTYFDIGTHRAIALCPVDDTKLGKLVVANKYKQEIVWGSEFLKVNWQENLGDTIKGLEKNMFPSFNYSIVTVVIMILLFLLIDVYAFAGIFLGGFISRIICGLSILIIFGVYGSFTKYSGISLPLWYAIFHPFMSIIMIYALLNSTFKAIYKGGIEWRGTLYPLGLLKNNKYSS